MTSLSFSLGLNMYAIGPIAPLITADYDVSNSTTGLLTSIVFFLHIIFAIPASLLVGRVPLKTIISLAGLTGSCSLLIFITPDSFAVLLILRALQGLSFILLFPALGPLFMQWFRPKELALVNGIFLISFSLGITTSNFVVAPLSEIIGWQLTLSIFGGAALASVTGWILFGKTSRIPGSNEMGSLIQLISKVIRNRETFLLALGDAGPFTLLTVCFAWLPTFYHTEYGISLTMTGFLMGLVSLGGFAALVLASLLSARIHKRRPFLIIPGITCGFAGLAVIVLGDSVGMYLAIAMLGFGCWFYLPILVTIPMELYPDDPRRVSLIFACIMAITSFCNFAGPPTVGVLADLTGSLVPGLIVFAVMAWSLAIAGILLPETGIRVSETGRTRG